MSPGADGEEMYGGYGITGQPMGVNRGYRSQLSGFAVHNYHHPSQSLVADHHRSGGLVGKRSLAEFQSQNQRIVNNYSFLHHRQHPQSLFGNPNPVMRRRAVFNLSPPTESEFRFSGGQQVLGSNNENCRNHLVVQPDFVAGAHMDQSSPSPVQDSDDRMLSKLRDLEKQLLDDAEDDVVSVVTNSEWSETTIQNLVVPGNNFLSPSPCSSTSSTSSSSSVLSSPPKQSLVEAASAMAEGNTEKAREILVRVSQQTEQRLAAFVATALLSRLRDGGSGSNCEEEETTVKSLYELSLCLKLSLWAANQAILDATVHHPEKIHVLDFNGGQGCLSVQYSHLVQALAARQEGKPLQLTITTFSQLNGEDNEKLRNLGERVGISVKLAGVKMAIGELSRQSLNCEEDEELVASLSFHLHRIPDESVRMDNPRDELLRRVKRLQPRVVVVAEQEMNANTAPLAVRVAEVCSFYEALFDSFGFTAARDDTERVRTEAELLKKMANAVACEGAERVERSEVSGKWRARFGMAGFRSWPLSQQLAESLQARVNSWTRGSSGFTIREDSGGIYFGWNGRSLAVASAWL